MEKTIARAELKNRDLLCLIEKDNKIYFEIKGCQQLRSHLEKLIAQQGMDIKNWVIEGRSHAELLIKKILFQIKNTPHPYQEAEVCHCRSVPLETIEEAIINGSHTIQSIRRVTTANTACGSCQHDVEAILRYWLEPIS